MYGQGTGETARDGRDVRDARDVGRDRLGAYPVTARRVDAVDARPTVLGVEELATLLGRRWRPSILGLLQAGPQRYNALLRQLPGATPKMLTQQLKALEDAGWVDRFARRGGARHTEYALSAAGETLRPVLDAFRQWATGAGSVGRGDAGARAERADRGDREITTTVVARVDTELRRVG